MSRHVNRGFKRVDRVSDEIQKSLAMLIDRELKDPRVSMVTINAVSVSKDLSYADIYVTFLSLHKSDGFDEEKIKESLSVLDKASGFLRTQLAKSMSFRTVPKLRFHYDKTLQTGNHMDTLIRQIKKPDQPNSAD